MMRPTFQNPSHLQKTKVGRRKSLIFNGLLASVLPSHRLCGRVHVSVWACVGVGACACAHTCIPTTLKLMFLVGRRTNCCQVKSFLRPTCRPTTRPTSEGSQ